MKKHLFLLLLLMPLIGCNILSGSQTQNTSEVSYHATAPFSISNPQQDTTNSINITKKATALATAWHNDAQLAGLSITYDSISETANKTGTYAYISNQDPNNIFQIVFRSGHIDQPDTKIISRGANNIPASQFANIIPFDRWKITSAGALAIADNNNGAVMRGMSTNPNAFSANTTLEFNNNILQWSVAYYSSSNSGTAIQTPIKINAETGEIIQ